MPRGIYFSTELKKVLFCIITFVENEKDGPLIPLNNCNARLVAMLGISETSLLRLKNEMRMLQVAQEELQPHHLRSQSKARRPLKQKPRSSSAASALMTNVLPDPQPPNQRVGRSSVHLSEQADSEIRYQFQLLLSEKIYPTTTNILERLHAAHDDFPIQSKTTLRCNLHRIGFRYKSSTKVKILLDHVSFVAQRAKFYRKIDELRMADALIFYHDESWLNVGEEKRSIWVDNEVRGRIRKNDGKDNVRKNNTLFRMTDVRDLAAEFIAGYDGDVSAKAIAHT
ncbi:unnamed protein product [Rotaria sp. Silwood2]|nr:unnamed protein product [Rotaria sp. Silwood2]